MPACLQSDVSDRVLPSAIRLYNSPRGFEFQITRLPVWQLLPYHLSSICTHRLEVGLSKIFNTFYEYDILILTAKFNHYLQMILI